ncbi:DUF1338 domain-containing protein [Halomonas sediminis]|uniref:2-oxoadipate dioxygenase/decarboxylase n=1 Tax=Vreelandella zhuhanensis TaxID=2684210 RepID=A0A7X3H0S4_9GAMM|nr:DUF1338 domain-containing protein [Halomonas zhuhanensis]MWJ28427.1 DUF1338 domain-containing protein [Halomonas zhuhanensis]
MQRDEFVQQLWLDYVHAHPDISSLSLFSLPVPAEYFTLLTLNHGFFSSSVLLSNLAHLGYRPVNKYAMADRGLLVHLLCPPDSGSWLVLAELQTGTLSREPRRQLEALISQAHPEDCRGQNLLSRGRPWPMPSWETYQLLYQAHPLAGWLAIMGPRLHHAGFDCKTWGATLTELDQQLVQVGLRGNADRHNGIFPISPLLNYRFYPTTAQRLPFSDGDEHRVSLGGLVLAEKQTENAHGQVAELLFPHHTRCELA